MYIGFIQDRGKYVKIIVLNSIKLLHVLAALAPTVAPYDILKDS